MRRKLFLSLIALLVLTGCEETIPFDTKTNRELTVYALAVDGQQFQAYIAQSRTIADGPNFYYLDYSDFSRQASTYFADSLVIRKADATLTVNGTESYKLTYVPDSLCYKCDYIAHSGDHLALDVDASGFAQVSSQCTVTAPVKIDDMSYYTYYDEAASAEQHDWVRQAYGYDIYGADSVTTITLSFHDPAETRNFYRLRVRSVGEYSSITGKRHSVCDVYTSSDPVFNDRQLTKGYGSWQAYFSDVFDDAIFNGKTYTITVNSRKRAEEPAYTIVELQSISPDLYYFLKSMQLYRISTDDIYTTPIAIFSNIDNGWGILGTLSYSRHVIY